MMVKIGTHVRQQVVHEAGYLRNDAIKNLRHGGMSSKVTGLNVRIALQDSVGL